MNQLAGVSLSLTEDGYEVAAIVLKREKGTVKIERSLTGTWQEIAEELINLKLPVALHVDGRGLLHKTVEKKDDQTDQALLNQVIPNAKVQDFFIQVADDNGLQHLSIIRREALSAVRKLFSEKELSVIRIFLGPFVAARLNYVADQPMDSLVVSGWKLKLNNVSVSAISVQREPVQDMLLLKGGERLNGVFLVPYAAALSALIYRQDEQFKPLSDEISGLRENWEQQRLFQRSLKIVLGSIFGLLLINVFLFIQASQKNDVLLQQLQGHQKTLLRLESLKEEVSHKKTFITQTAWGDVPRAAFYADRLAATLPEPILLTDVSIHPLDEKTLKDERKHLFRSKIVQVRGKCSKPHLVNEWIQILVDADWVDDVTDQEYEYSSQERTGKFFFTIKLKPLE